VAILQADRLYEIEQGINSGNVGDFWIKDMILGTGGAAPNTDSYQGGVVKPTGFTIEILSDPGLIMVFKVTGIGSRSTVVLPSGEVFEGGETGYSNDSTGTALAWLLSVLGGLGLMLGLALVVL
jgi:hypothetical protein